MEKLKMFFKTQNEKGRIKDVVLFLLTFGLNMLGLLAILILITFGWPHLK